MENSDSSDPLTRAQKRVDFARRLTSHRVRTGTIVELTGLTLNRLTGLRKGWGIRKETRLRGRYPSTLDRFLSSPEARTDTAAVLAVCRVLDALPEIGRDYAPDSKLYFDSALRLCNAFEAYHACRPGSDLEFDDLMQLVRELSTQKIISLGKCKTCLALVVIAKHDPLRPICSHCRQDTRTCISGKARPDVR
jgi:hypothetical protein